MVRCEEHRAGEPQPGGGIDKIIKDKIMGAEGTAGWGNINHGLRGFSRMGKGH
jgi:hypothetical protein